MVTPFRGELLFRSAVEPRRSRYRNPVPLPCYTDAKQAGDLSMDWDALDDDVLGHAVDAWLVSLRLQGLSDRRRRALAGLLGRSMSQSGYHTPEEAAVLARFAAWWREQVDSANTPESGRPR